MSRGNLVEPSYNGVGITDYKPGRFGDLLIEKVLERLEKILPSNTKSQILPFGAVFHAMGSGFSLKKAEIWELLLFMAKSDPPDISIVYSKGIVLLRRSHERKRTMVIC